MRKLVYCCDNCKREYESEGIKESCTVEIKVRDLGRDVDYQAYDICMECRRMFLRIFEKAPSRLPQNPIINLDV